MWNQFVYTKAQETDLSNLVAIFAALQDEPNLTRRSRQDVKRHLGEFIVARARDGKVVGCIVLQKLSPTIAYLRSLAVLPEYRKQRVGAALVKAALAESQRRGYERAFALVKDPLFFTRLGMRSLRVWLHPWQSAQLVFTLFRAGLRPDLKTALRKQLCVVVFACKTQESFAPACA